jgi:outer membrane protein TolC
MFRRSLAISTIATILLPAGCNLVGPNKSSDAELAHYKQVAQTVEHPQLNTPPSEHAFTPEPRTIDHNGAPQQPQQWWDLSLAEAIEIAVTRSTVLRDLGGTIVRSPDAVRTILAPSVVASDARFGMEAALSEFDATVATSVIAEKNDRMVNNFVSSGGTRFFQQDLITFQSQLSKLNATGGRTTFRGISIYDFNNASFNRFPSVWDTLVEAEFRQPLLQGSGARFNRIAGPSGVPGFYNGVMIARVNTDISVADFEMGMRDLVSNVENAYWDLYFAYRDLDARIRLRNASLEAWKRIKVLVESDQAGGQIEREVQAREQYFRYEEDVQNALAGTLQQATTNNNGASGGSFRGLGGVLVTERRLRLAIGLPITDNRFIRPADEPTLAKVNFQWEIVSDDAIARRPELLKQRLLVKRREMEYVAARNFLLPRFDILGRYRFRGLGRDLIGDQHGLPVDPTDPNGFFARSSLGNLASGNFQEWQLGGEVNMPVGFRRGWAAVRNAQLNVARDKAVLEEQERQVMHDLSNALGDMQRAYKNMETTYNRRLAAQQNVDILRFRLQSSQPVSAEQLLDGERRLAEADVQHHRALVEHMLAIKNVHFEKGTLLEYGQIQLADQFFMSDGAPMRRPLPASEPTPATTPPESLPPALPPSLDPLPPPPAPAPLAPPATDVPPPLPAPPAFTPPMLQPAAVLPVQPAGPPTVEATPGQLLRAGSAPKATAPIVIVPQPSSVPAKSEPTALMPPAEPAKPLLEWSSSGRSGDERAMTIPRNRAPADREVIATFATPPKAAGVQATDIPIGATFSAATREVQRSWYVGQAPTESAGQRAFWVNGSGTAGPPTVSPAAAIGPPAGVAVQPGGIPSAPMSFSSLPPVDPVVRLPQPDGPVRLPPPVDMP